MLRFITLAVLSAATIGAVWAWLGAPVAMPDSAIGHGEKLYCMSYAPFRHSQSPLDPATHIDPAQIEDDIARLAKLTDCVRTYSVDFGLDRIAEIAGRHGMKVIQGLWLSGLPDKTHYQIETAVALANKYPNVIRAVVVGNEVLLRGEMSAVDLAAIIRAVKARVPVPVTYADVWEFWLRNPALADAADFITIHILPYWEDDPIPASHAAAHVESIRRRVAQAFPSKEIMIGEFGWPSAGRMREGALPSPANQARTIQEVVALAKRENFRVNVIEAFDQPWKRTLEGTVGGNWGLFDDETRDFKFAWGAPVSSHPQWRRQAPAGIIFAGLIFFAAAARRRKFISLTAWLAVTAIAIVAGINIGWAVENIPGQSIGLGGWLRSLALLAVALMAPPLAANAIVSARAPPRFSQLLGESGALDREARTFGAVLIAVTVLALMVALGLAFDPRYRDFPFAPLSCAIVPFFLLGLVGPRPRGSRGAAEIAAAAVLAACAGFISFNETLANWQSLWLCGLLVALAVTLARVRAAQD
jgi:exo-beta-1,3-glucanase (GH17 family)